MTRTRLILLTLVIVTLTIGGWAVIDRVVAQEKSASSEFARTTIDLGVCVSDINKSAKFYTEAIGFKEIDGFSVPADFCKESGLTDSKQLDIRVFVLGDDESATKIKLMQVPGTQPKKSDNSYVHSQYGFRYLTLMINDTSAALKRLDKAGVKPVAKGPVPLPAGLPQGVFLTVVQDPDGNLVELVGPKK